MASKLTGVLCWCGLLCLCLVARAQRLRSDLAADIINLRHVYTNGNITFCNETSIPSSQTIVVNNGTIYVGTTNAILQISSREFGLKSVFHTGPGNDSVHCNGPFFCPQQPCSQTPFCVDNYNKVLVTDRTKVVACGTAYRTCDLLKSQDVSQTFLNPNDLKCGAPANSILSVRNPNVPMVAAVSESEGNNNLLYLGTAEIRPGCAKTIGDNYVDAECLLTSIKTYHFPTGGKSPKNHFSLVDDSKKYIKYGQANKVSFVYMWSTADHLFTIRKSVSGAPLARISRTCHEIFRNVSGTPSYGPNSYVESEITCRVNGVTFTNVTAAQYSQGKLFVLFSNATINQHAVCAIKLSDINVHLNGARSFCFRNDNNMTAELINKDGKNMSCTLLSNTETASIECTFPEEYLAHLAIAGVRSLIPTRMSDFILFDDPKYGDLSAFVVTKSSNKTVAFVGSNQGLIFKANNRGGKTVVSETIPVSAQPILKDLRTDENGQFVLGITPMEVFRIKFENCESLMSCGECLSSQDPFCGWCIHQSLCTSKQMCNIGQWLSTDLNQSFCPSVSTIQPKQIQIHTPSEINLVFEGTRLVSQPHPYSCRFTRNDPGHDVFNYSSTVTNFPTKPSCTFNPSSFSALVANHNEDHVNVTLTIEYQGRIMAESKRQLIVYDCQLIPRINNQSMCSSCQTSQWNCTWCIHGETCKSAGCTDGSPLVTSTSDCPTVVGFADAPTYFVPYGMERLFILNTTNLDPTLNGAKKFECVYEKCGKIVKSQSNVNINSMTVECTALPELISCQDDWYEVKVFLQRDNYIIDSPNPPTAIVYNCEKRSRDCGTCLQFHQQFTDCRWCNSSSKCSTADQCSQLVSVTKIAQCPAPTIVSISPLNGPVEGGTEVIIQGVNLGVVASDIASITVGQISCVLDERLYKPSTTVVCKTSASSVPVSSRIKLQTNYSRAVYSTERFQYRIVDVSRAVPTEVMNRAKITIYGNALSVGNSARIIVDNISSTCDRRNETTLTCKCPSVTSSGNYTLAVAVDGYMKNLAQLLQYFPLPRVVQPETLFGFTSGGRIADIQLSDVRGIQTASLRIDKVKDQACEVNRTSSLVSCPTPSEPGTNAKRKRRSNLPSSSTQQRTYNVSLVINNEQVIPAGVAKYQNDPQLTSVSQLPCASTTTSSNGNRNATVTSAGDTVTVQIQGKGFDDIYSKKSDYVVTLYPSNSVSIACYVSFVESTSLFCRARAQSLKKYENSRITVKVSSNNWSSEVPDVMYCQGTNNNLIIGFVVVAVFFVLVSIVVALACWRRVKKQRQEQKLILSKLDDLENKTRETARNAYYELQVGYMTNLTDNLSDRITYLPTSAYFTQTLFNKTTGHPVQDKAALQRLSVHKMEALDEWLRLIKKRDFLITFIRTLEEQRRFTVQDKGSVASYLTACLLSDLPYYTRIMFELLSHLIDKHVAKNPKLLLRRSESVVEKMVSHWLSITLYDECIMKNAGKPIFLLTKAIHYLVSSTPCDVIANKAMNSLNEMTLLGSEVSYETVVLHATVVDELSERLNSTVDVKVVNVDTVTQAKTKIIEAVYKDRPYSECPKPDDLEFEMLSSNDRKEGIILSDIDKTSEQDGHFTKLNTLKHYNVPAKAIVVLRPPGDDMSASQDSKSPLLATERRTLYHLIHPRDDDSANGGLDMDDDKSGKKANARIDNLMNRPFQEMFLTRMVKAKTTLQEYVESVFGAILCPKPIPKSVRYFFQYLDNEAAKHKVSEPEVIHIWKTNSLLLRYWVNVLKNPEFLFDTNKTAIVDSCLNVITQAFMDACTTTNRKLGHGNDADSPSNKLLYAKDAENYKTMVKEFFVNVSNTDHLSKEEMDDLLRSKSKEYGNQLNELVAAQMLASYLIKYREQVTETFRDSDRAHFAKTVDSICEKLGENSWETTVV